MDAHVTYRVIRTAWVGGTYVTEGATVTLPASVGSVCRHLAPLDGEPTTATLSLADAPSSRRVKKSAG